MSLRTRITSVQRRTCHGCRQPCAPCAFAKAKVKFGVDVLKACVILACAHATVEAYELDSVIQRVGVHHMPAKYLQHGASRSFCPTSSMVPLRVPILYGVRLLGFDEACNGESGIGSGVSGLLVPSMSRELTGTALRSRY